MNMNGQQLFVCKEEWSSSMDQEEPEPPDIKEEQEELWTTQEGEQLPGLEEADIIKFTFNPDLVKSEYDEEEQLHSTQADENSEPLASTSSGHIKTEADGEDCGVSEAARNLDPAGGLEPSREDQLLSSDLKSETDDSDDWEQETQSGVKPQKSPQTPGCGGGVGGGPETHLQVHALQKPFSCAICKKVYTQRNNLNRHMRYHTEGRPFSCRVCKKCFTYNCSLKQHMKTHSGERPFSCSFCSRAFTRRTGLKHHMIVHTGERPFSCTVCTKYFALNSSLKLHMMTHTGERPFSCSVCKKGFTQKGGLKQHMMTHTGERPFTCTVCKKDFAHNSNLIQHMMTHTGKIPFSCAVCKREFSKRGGLKQHMTTHKEVDQMISPDYHNNTNMKNNV